MRRGLSRCPLPLDTAPALIIAVAKTALRFKVRVLVSGLGLRVYGSYSKVVPYAFKSRTPGTTVKACDGLMEALNPKP